MTTKLSVYNDALRDMGERQLSALDSPATEQSQIELDAAWDNGTLDYCLEQALWNFATRSVSLSYDPDTTPSFGLQFAFNKPSDWIKTSALCSDPRFEVPILDYRDKSGYWFSDHDTIYLEYVSNDSSYGGDMSLWPQTFVKVVAAWLAVQTCERITQSRVKRSDMEEKFYRRLHDASAKDAFNQASKPPPSGSWVRSRASGWRSDRGSRGRLIG